MARRANLVKNYANKSRGKQMMDFIGRLTIIDVGVANEVYALDGQCCAFAYEPLSRRAHCSPCLRQAKAFTGRGNQLLRANCYQLLSKLFHSL